MSKRWFSGHGMGLLLVAFLAAGLVAVAGFVQAMPASGSTLQAPATSVAKGGRLYDEWWQEAGLPEPTGDHPLWATQTTNTRKGADTWRCKECHGWDYLGKDGTYGSGSHKTGFVGVSDAGKSKTAEQLTASLKGANNPKHNFSSVLSDALIGDLVNFLKEGLIDDRQYIDYATTQLKNANADHGKGLYGSVCTFCHGVDGKQILIDGTEWLGDVTRDEPAVEMLHKIRVGQPGTAMPSAFVAGWNVQDVVDVLAYERTLPSAKAAAPAPVPAAAPAALPKTGDAMLPQAVIPAVLVLSLLLLGLGLGLMRRITRA